MSVNDGGPVYPHLHESCQRVNDTEMHPGMSLRDYFAAAVLQGFCAAPEFNWENEHLARRSYAIADAMLRERAK